MSSSLVENPVHNENVFEGLIKGIETELILRGQIVAVEGGLHKKSDLVQLENFIISVPFTFGLFALFVLLTTVAVEDAGVERRPHIFVPLDSYIIQELLHMVPVGWRQSVGEHPSNAET